MYKNFTQCENWDDILTLVTQLINENEKLKEEKQQLVSELINLKLQIKQSEKRRQHAYKVLISEM